MEEIHWADLGTCDKSEARTPTSQQVSEKLSWNASWSLILDLLWRIFDTARFYSALKSFRMPKYNTVHDVFLYLYLFWTNPIIQSLTLHVPSKLYGRIQLEELLSAKIFYFRIKTTRSKRWSLLFPQVVVDGTWISQKFSNVSSARNKMRSCNLASCLSLHNRWPRNSAFVYHILFLGCKNY